MFTIDALMQAYDAEVRGKLAVARTLDHPGENGRAREQILRTFLRSLIPSEYGVDTGFAIDSSGRISRQLDIVVFRRDYFPVFKVGEISHFPVEGVAAVIENKADMSATNKLEDALDNIRSVKALDRGGSGDNHELLGGAGGANVRPFDPARFEHQIFGAVLTEKSLTRETFLAALRAFCSTHPRTEWMNSYVDVRGYTASYSADGHHTNAPMEAKKILITNPEATGRPPLIDFAYELLAFLKTSAHISYTLTKYMSVGETDGDEHDF